MKRNKPPLKVKKQPVPSWILIRSRIEVNSFFSRNIKTGLKTDEQDG
jgi:hypothetical protein